ncbi:MAG: ABC transporter permease [Oscillospiraceae bacterium]|jgi:peptide/nickel transport system permease protein
MENKEQRLGVKKLSMAAKYLLRAAGLIFAIISINFLLIHFMPGDPLIHILGDEQYFTLLNQFPEKLAEVRAQYSLNGSLWQQYIHYLWQVITLQFGHSYIGGESVVSIVLFRMRWTITLSLCAIVISALIGGSLGVLAGYHKGGKLDSVLTAIFLFLETIPANCLALILLVVFSYKLRWFPVGGMVSGGLIGWKRIVSILHHMVLPVLVLSLFRTSSNFLLMKSYVSQIREEDYITVAVAKGISKTHVLFRHVLRNVLVPFVTTLCLQIGHILSGSMLIEVVFSWKGMGTLIYDAVNNRDYPTVQMCFLLIAICVVLFNFISDMLCMYIDPRIQDGMKNE